MKTILAATFALLSCGAAFAQGLGPGGPGGFGGRPGFGPDGPMHGPRPVSVMNLPLRTLSAYLGITDAQKGKIAQIREDMRGGMRPPAPGQGGPQGDMRGKRNAAEQKAAAQIKTVLSAQQNARLATLVKAAQGLAYARLQPEALAKLQLTPAQLTRLSALTPQTAPKALPTILSRSQKEVAKGYQMPQPPQGRGLAGEIPPPPPAAI